MKRWPLLLAATVAILFAACRDATAPSATCLSTSGGQATVTGCWIEPSIDTHTQFVLVQHEGAVSGTFAFCGPVGGCGPSYRVTGTFRYLHVSLQWTEVSGQQRSPHSFDGTLSADGDTLVCIDSTVTAGRYSGAPGLHHLQGVS